MQTIKKKYIIDEKNKKIAVQIDIKTYNKIEEILENFALAHLIKENEGEETLNPQEAAEYYNNLDKSS